MPKRLRATASSVLGVVSLVCGWMADTRCVRAHSDDLPALLPDDEPAPATAADMPATLSDEQAMPAEESSAPPIRFEASVSAALSVPIGHNPDVAGFGFAATYGAGWDEIPLALGVDFISVGSIGDADSLVDVTLMGETQRAERDVNTRLLHFDAWLRLQPAHYPVRPYVEGFIGAQLFQGKYILKVGNEESERGQAADWGRNFGWGLGVEFPGLLNGAGSMSLTLGMRRVYGEAVKVARSVVLGNERVQTRYEADTSVLLFMVGIGLHYDLAGPEPERDFMGH